MKKPQGPYVITEKELRGIEQDDYPALICKDVRSHTVLEWLCNDEEKLKSPLAELFGNTDEIKVWSVLVPYALNHTVSEAEIITATGMSQTRVSKVLSLLEKRIIIGKDRKMIKFSDSTARAVHQLIHAAYDDALIKEQERLLKGDKNDIT